MPFEAAPEFRNCPLISSRYYLPMRHDISKKICNEIRKENCPGINIKNSLLLNTYTNISTKIIGGIFPSKRLTNVNITRSDITRDRQKM